MITIAVDCMGGDVGPAATLPACSAFLASHPQAQLLLVGLPDTFNDWPQLLNNVRCRVVPASEVVAMDDPVEVALRNAIHGDGDHEDVPERAPQAPPE